MIHKNVEIIFQVLFVGFVFVDFLSPSVASRAREWRQIRNVHNYTEKKKKN